jgi:uncharacterized Zn-finger protein
MSSTWDGRYIKMGNADNVPNADCFDSPHTPSMYQATDVDRLARTNSDMYMDVKPYYDSQPTVHYSNAANRNRTSKGPFSDVFPEHNGETLETVVKKERNDTTCLCTDTKLELVDNTDMTQVGHGYQYSMSQLFGNTLPLRKFESDTKLVKTERTSTPDPADSMLCDKRCMYDSYMAVNTDSGMSHSVVASITSIHRSEMEHTPTVTAEHRTTPPNGRAHTGDDKPHTCGVCIQSFAHKSMLERHTRTHTGAKPYTCDVCMQSFSLKSTLVSHTRLHTGDEPYKCDVCMKSFSQKSTLVSHTRLHTGDKPYKCAVCMESFTHKTSLRAHTRRYTGDKPYKCDVCMKTFSQKSHLVDHTRIHTGDKPYKCDVCMKTFSQRGNLTVHNLTHTGDKL